MTLNSFIKKALEKLEEGIKKEVVDCDTAISEIDEIVFDIYDLSNDEKEYVKDKFHTFYKKKKLKK